MLVLLCCCAELNVYDCYIEIILPCRCGFRSVQPFRGHTGLWLSFGNGVKTFFYTGWTGYHRLSAEGFSSGHIFLISKLAFLG